MNKIVYLNYKIYNRGIKKGESEFEARITAMLIAVPILLFLNIFTLLLLIRAVNPLINIDFNRKNAIILMGLFMASNYFIVYFGGRSKHLFNKIQKKDSVKNSYYVKAYIVFSFLLPCLLAMMQDFLKKGTIF